jgi:hypothetical protein
MKRDISAEVERRLQALRAQYADRFTEDQFSGIRTNIERSVTAGSKLHDCELPNEIGPDFDPRAMTRA